MRISCPRHLEWQSLVTVTVMTATAVDTSGSAAQCAGPGEPTGACEPPEMLAAAAAPASSLHRSTVWAVSQPAAAPPGAAEPNVERDALAAAPVAGGAEDPTGRGTSLCPPQRSFAGVPLSPGTAQNQLRERASSTRGVEAGMRAPVALARSPVGGTAWLDEWVRVAPPPLLALWSAAPPAWVDEAAGEWSCSVPDRPRWIHCRQPVAESSRGTGAIESTGPRPCESTDAAPPLAAPPDPCEAVSSPASGPEAPTLK